MGNSLRDATDHLADQASPGYTTATNPGDGTKTLVKNDNPDFVAGQEKYDFIEKRHPGAGTNLSSDDAVIGALTKQLASDKKRAGMK